MRPLPMVKKLRTKLGAGNVGVKAAQAPLEMLVGGWELFVAVATK